MNKEGMTSFLQQIFSRSGILFIKLIEDFGKFHWNGQLPLVVSKFCDKWKDMTVTTDFLCFAIDNIQDFFLLGHSVVIKWSGMCVPRETL